MRNNIIGTDNVVQAAARAGGEALGGELFLLNMGEPVRIADLAADLVRLSGFEAHEVAIVHARLRPGEQLHEALWEEGSTVEALGNGDVFRVVEAVSPPSGHRLRSIVQTLADSARRGETHHLRRLLSEAIPTFDEALRAH